MQLGTKRNYKEVEEKLLGFVLVYKFACTDRVARKRQFCQNSTLIVNLTFDNSKSERITMLSKMFSLFRSSFLSRIQLKKVEGQTFLGFVLLIRLSVYFVAGKTIFRCLISACLHCLWQKNTFTLGST